MTETSVTEKKTGETLEQKAEKLQCASVPSLKADLCVAPFAAVSGASCGFLSSLFDPLFLYHGSKSIRNPNSESSEHSIRSFMFKTTALMTYFMGVSNFVIEPILKEPTDPKSYFGLAANVVGGLVQLAYHVGYRNARTS